MRVRLLLVLLCVGLWIPVIADERTGRSGFNEAVIAAYVATHDGWSSDEVILQTQLNASFLAHCKESVPDADAFRFNWTLLNLRKAGKLSGVVKVTKRRRDQVDDYLHAAEIASRFMHDKHGISTDRMICDPEYRREYDTLAKSVTQDVDVYLLRKAAFRLRKSRRLRPELVLRIADWGRQVVSLKADDAIADTTLIPDRPGIYIFRDQSGYLYIGESYNLRSRVSKHLDHSDRKALAHYLWRNGTEGITVELHAFDPDSKGRDKTHRRAYESELIRSREPKFNIAP